jgi:hypothetical protein
MTCRADSMDVHFQGADERTASALEFMEPEGWEIYGEDSDAARGLDATDGGIGPGPPDHPSRIPGWLHARRSLELEDVGPVSWCGGWP